MALIVVPQHSPEDLAYWRRMEREDAIWARSKTLAVRVQTAMDAIMDFARAGKCYVAVSWGKDSTVVAHLVYVLRETRGLTLPLVWNKCENVHPWTAMVRDQFLDRFWGEDKYFEVELHRNGMSLDQWFEAGIRAIAETLGTSRWIGGVRAEESSARARRISRGLAVGQSCCPLGEWSARDVWAYIYRHDLPVHPVYACTRGGALDRDRIRVAGLLDEEVVYGG